MSDLPPRNAPNDGELLFRLSRGDEPAYRLLHDRHQADVFRVALLLVRTSRDAEEVAATAFFELWRKRRSVRMADGSVLPWLLATTSRTAKNGLRSRRRYRRLLGRIPREDRISENSDEIARVTDALNVSREFHDALVHVNGRDASIIVLCVVNGLPTAEAAVVLRIPEGVVKSRLSRMQARWRTAPDPYTPKTEGVTA